MELKTTAKIGIFTGIAAIIFFSAIFAIAMSDNIRESVMLTFLDKEAKMAEMKELPSVIAFAEKYPDHYVQENKNRHNVGLEMFDYDFETGNQLRLNVNYDIWDDRIREHIRCNVEDNRYRSNLGFSQNFAMSSDSIGYPQIFLNEGRAEDQFVLDFIKYTNCLEMNEEEADVRQTSIPNKNSESDSIVHIAVNSGVPGCDQTNSCYAPNRVDIPEGDVVEWKNIDGVAHTVTSGTPEDGPTEFFDSAIIESGQNFRVQFDKAGTYDYFCMIHPWQEGLVVVEAPVESVTGSYTLEE